MTNKNSDNLFESLSALMDDEASELELHRILKHIETNDELRQHWERYHIISSIMRKDREYADSEGSLFARVSEAVSREATYGEAVAEQASEEANAASGSSGALKSDASAKTNWSNVFGKTAVAASFAAAVVLMSPVLQQVAVEETDRPAVQVASSSEIKTPVMTTASAPEGFAWNLPEARTVNNAANALSANSLVDSTPELTQANDPQLQALLNELLLEHANRASQNGGLSLLPYARVSRIDSAALEPAVSPSKTSVGQ